MAQAKKIKKTEPKTKIEVITPTEQDLIFGETEKKKVVTVVDYTSIEAKYNVEICANGRTMKANGREIGAFLGLNEKAREELKQGAQKVEISEPKNIGGIIKNVVKYKIEVI